MENNDYEFINYINHKDDYQISKEQNKPIKYYQITMYKNPQTKYRLIRIFDIDENNNFKNIKTLNLTSEMYHKFLKRVQPNKDKLLPTYNFDEVKPPSLYDISLSRSSLLQ